MPSHITAVGERRGLLGVRFENMRRIWVMEWGAQQGLGVVASQWLVSGKTMVQIGRVGWGAIAWHHCHVFFKFTYAFRLSFWIRVAVSEYLPYMNSCTIHIYFVLFTFLSDTYLKFNFGMLDVIIGWHTWILFLSPSGERVAKYEHTNEDTRTKKKAKKKIFLQEW